MAGFYVWLSRFCMSFLCSIGPCESLRSQFWVLGFRIFRDWRGFGWVMSLSTFGVLWGLEDLREVWESGFACRLCFGRGGLGSVCMNPQPFLVGRAETGFKTSRTTRARMPLDHGVDTRGSSWGFTGRLFRISGFGGEVL